MTALARTSVVRSLPRVAIAAIVISFILLVACSEDSQHGETRDAGGLGGAGASTGTGGASTGGTFGCDCSPRIFCDGDVLHIEDRQTECGCTGDVLTCEHGCYEDLSGYPYCGIECSGELCPPGNPPVRSTLLPIPCCTDAGACGVEDHYGTLGCVPIYPPGIDDPDCPMWRNTWGCCRDNGLCGVLDPAEGAGCVDPKVFGIDELVNCDGVPVDAGIPGDGGTDATVVSDAGPADAAPD